MVAAIPPVERMLDYLRAARNLAAEDATAPIFGNPHRLVSLAALRTASAPLVPEQLVIAATQLVFAAELLEQRAADGGRAAA